MEINGRTITVSNPNNWLTENSPVDDPTFVETRILANGEQPSDYREVDSDGREAVRRMAAIRRSSRGNQIDEYVRHGTISIYSPVGHVYKYNGIVALPLTVNGENRYGTFAFDLMPFCRFGHKPNKVELDDPLHYGVLNHRIMRSLVIEFNPDNSILKVKFTADDQFAEKYPGKYETKVFVSLDNLTGKLIRLRGNGYFENYNNHAIGYRINPLQITEDTIKKLFSDLDDFPNNSWDIQKLRRRRIWMGEGVEPKRFSKWSGRWEMSSKHHTGVFRIRKRMTNGDYTDWVRFSSYEGVKIRIF